MRVIYYEAPKEFIKKHGKRKFILDNLKVRREAELHPYCNCEKCYEFNGKKLSKYMANGEAISKITRSSDKETCDFCQHYVEWKEAGRKRYTQRKTQ